MSYVNDSNILELLADQTLLAGPVIRPLRHLAELQEVYRLTHNCYVGSGYSRSHPSGLLVHYPYFDHIPETTTLLAYVRGQIVGSISLTEDGPSGMTIDEDFKRDCDALRQEGKPLGAIWRLVVEESTRSKRTVVIHLMKAMLDLLLRKNISTALMTVHPKHQSIYQRMLNAAVAAEAGSTGGLLSAPAVLLRFDPSDLPAGSVLCRGRDPDLHPLRDLIVNSAY